VNNGTAGRLWLAPIAVFVIVFGTEFLGSFVPPDSRAPIRPVGDALCLAIVAWLTVWCARRATPRVAFWYGAVTGAAYMVATPLGWAFGVSASLRAEGAKGPPISDLGSALYLWLPFLALVAGLTVGGLMAAVVRFVQLRRK